MMTMPMKTLIKLLSYLLSNFLKATSKGSLLPCTRWMQSWTVAEMKSFRHMVRHI